MLQPHSALVDLASQFDEAERREFEPLRLLFEYEVQNDRHDCEGSAAKQGWMDELHDVSLFPPVG